MFDPYKLQPLDPLGTVYGTLELSAEWGVLKVSNGALMAADWSKVFMPAPSDLKARPLVGNGWTLTLNENWQLIPGERTGDFRLGKIAR